MRPTSKQLADLVPLNDLPSAAREALIPYSELLRLAPGAPLVSHTEHHACYLLSGSVTPDGESGKPDPEVKAQDLLRGEPNHALAPRRRLTAGADGAELVRTDRGRVGTMLAWEELRQRQRGDGDPPRPLPEHWLAPILRSELLARLPGQNLQALLTRSESVSVKAGERVIEQGAPGDEYYLVLEGELGVYRETQAGMFLQLARLTPGDSFGEEALLSDSARNASVDAETSAELLRIAHADFVALVRARLVRTVSFATAQEQVRGGALWVDVRTAEEFAHDALPEARNIPLAELRHVRDELSRLRSYVTVCDSGKRAATAAFLLREAGLDATAVETGVVGMREAGARKPQGRTLEQLQADLAVADAELEEALLEQAALEPQIDEQPERTDPALRLRIESARKTLEAATHKKLEAERMVRDAQANAARSRAELEVVRDRLRKEAEERLNSERTRLEREYARATLALDTLRRSQDEAAADAERRHAQVDEALARTQAELAERAEAIQESMQRTAEDARVREATTLRDRTRNEEALVQKTEERLRDERLRIEIQFARSMAQLQVAESRLQSLEKEREESKRRASAHAASLRVRRDAHRAALQARVENAVDRAERTGNTGGGAPGSALLSAPARGDDDPMLAIETAAAEENLRLALQQEVEELLTDEQALVRERAEHARRQLEFVAAQEHAARERAEAMEKSEAHMLADIRTQLAADLEEGAKAAGERAYAESMGELTQQAKQEMTREREQARKALEQARAHIARLKSD